jgi:hypothetical protein
MRRKKHGKEVGLAKALIRAFESLAEECWDAIVDEKIDTGLVYTIGEWSRIKLLERVPEADVFLADEDIALLQAEWLYYNAGQFEFDERSGALSPARLSQAKSWHDASLLVRESGFVIHESAMVQTGMRSDEEAVFVFGLANKLIAWMQTPASSGSPLSDAAVRSEIGLFTVSHRSDQRLKPYWLDHCKTALASGVEISTVNDLLNLEGYDPSLARISGQTLRKWAREAGVLFKAGRPKTMRS